jgi:hypothetical protein
METKQVEQQPTQSLYVIDVTSKIGSDYIEMFNDVARFIIIQVAIQIMLYTMNPDRFHFFTADFFMLLLFIVIGVLLYWLVFKKIVSFK